MHLAPFASLVQIRERAGTEVAISDPSDDDVLLNEVQQARGRAHRSGCYLEKLHIFVLAHVMRRPIVVYQYDGDQPRGSILSGIYLPDLWGELGERDGCSRVPLCLVYTGGTDTGLGHFTACVGAEGHALVLPLSDHVRGERLLIRYGPDHVDIGPSGAASTVAHAGEATPVDTPTAWPKDSWAEHAALHVELTWSGAGLVEGADSGPTVVRAGGELEGATSGDIGVDACGERRARRAREGRAGSLRQWQTASARWQAKLPQQCVCACERPCVPAIQDEDRERAAVAGSASRPKRACACARCSHGA